MNALTATGCVHARPTSAGRWMLLWPLLLATALWPHWRWALARVQDGSDDPLGLAALAVLIVAVIRQAVRGAPEMRSGWQWLSVAVCVLATLAWWRLPPLIGALLAALTLVAGLLAVLPAGMARLPLAGLAVLSLPVVSSMQFYAGYPLRALTAQVSVWLLSALGMTTERSGAAMTVNGQLILVDAPCSGVQMVWMAYFCALSLALLVGRSDRFLLQRLPLVGLLVMAGNIVRNSVLVGLEASGVTVAEWLHQGIGLAVLAAVCGGVVWLVGRGRDARV